MTSAGIPETPCSPESINTGARFSRHSVWFYACWGTLRHLLLWIPLLRTSPLSIVAVSGSLYHQWNFVCIVGHLLVRRAWCYLLKYILDFTNCRFYFATATPHNRLHDNLVNIVVVTKTLSLCVNPSPRQCLSPGDTERYELRMRERMRNEWKKVESK